MENWENWKLFLEEECLGEQERERWRHKLQKLKELQRKKQLEEEEVKKRELLRRHQQILNMISENQRRKQLEEEEANKRERQRREQMLNLLREQQRMKQLKEQERERRRQMLAFTNRRVLFSTDEWISYGNYGSYFYHYTSISNAISILRDRRIFAHTPKRAQYGVGVFFTIYSPDFEDELLIKNNYIYYSDKYSEKVECAFAIRREHVNAFKVGNRDGRDVWQHGRDVDLTRISYKLISRRNKYIFDQYIAMGQLDII